MNDPALPIGDGEFASLMAAVGPFDAGRRVVVAVSGGADSVALAWLSSRWGAPLAAIVDHGLRAESAAEAALTAARCAGFGVASVIVHAGLRAGAAQAARARAARYQLLSAVCRDQGRPDLVVAHHAADQAETVRMRADSGSGMQGLAGMAAVDYRAEARLVRPLLAIDPRRLRATLRRAGVEWVEDPSNMDGRSLRSRVRLAMTPCAQTEALALAAQAGTARDDIERSVAAALARTWIAPEGFAVVPESLDGAALSAVIWTVSGRAHPPPRDAVRARGGGRTVHGVVLRNAGRLGPGMLIAREPGAVEPAVTAREGVVWDGRFRLTGRVPDGLMVGAVGLDAAALRRRSRLPAVVLATLPALRRDGVLWAVPHLPFPDASTCPSVQATFWPSRPAVPSAVYGGAVNPSFFRGV